MNMRVPNPPHEAVAALREACRSLLERHTSAGTTFEAGGYKTAHGVVLTLVVRRGERSCTLEFHALPAIVVRGQTFAPLPNGLYQYARVSEAVEAALTGTAEPQEPALAYKRTTDSATACVVCGGSGRVAKPEGLPTDLPDSVPCYSCTGSTVSEGERR